MEKYNLVKIAMIIIMLMVMVVTQIVLLNQDLFVSKDKAVKNCVVTVK